MLLIVLIYKELIQLKLIKMNQDQEARLEKIFRDNHNRGIAIAIIGCWGIGKTFAWNKFIREGAGLEKDRRYLPLNIRLKYPNIFNKNIPMFRCLVLRVWLILK